MDSRARLVQKLSDHINLSGLIACRLHRGDLQTRYGGGVSIGYTPNNRGEAREKEIPLSSVEMYAIFQQTQETRQVDDDVPLEPVFDVRNFRSPSTGFFFVVGSWRNIGADQAFQCRFGSGDLRCFLLNTFQRSV